MWSCQEPSLLQRELLPACKTNLDVDIDCKRIVSVKCARTLYTTHPINYPKVPKPSPPERCLFAFLPGTGREEKQVMIWVPHHLPWKHQHKYVRDKVIDQFLPCVRYWRKITRYTLVDRAMLVSPKQIKQQLIEHVVLASQHTHPLTSISVLYHWSVV